MTEDNRKSVVKGGTIPYCPVLYPILKNPGAGILFQQIHWLSWERGGEEGWHFASLEDFSLALGGVPRSSIARWLEKMEGLGIVERSRWQDELDRYAYRVDRTRLKQIGPGLRIREMDTTSDPESSQSGTPPLSQNGTLSPLHNGDSGVAPSRACAQDQDQDIDVDGENNHYEQQHVGSDERIEDNSTGEVFTAKYPRPCVGCEKEIPVGGQFLLLPDRGEFHPDCLPTREKEVSR